MASVSVHRLAVSVLEAEVSHVRGQIGAAVTYEYSGGSWYEFLACLRDILTNLSVIPGECPGQILPKSGPRPPVTVYPDKFSCYLRRMP